MNVNNLKPKDKGSSVIFNAQYSWSYIKESQCPLDVYGVVKVPNDGMNILCFSIDLVFLIYLIPSSKVR